MKTLLLSVLLSSAALAANVCDGNYRNQGALRMKCEVIADSLVVRLSASTADTKVMAVTVGWHDVAGKHRQRFLLDAPPPWPADLARILRVTYGAVIDYVGVEELQIFNSAGFVQ